VMAGPGSILVRASDIQSQDGPEVRSAFVIDRYQRPLAKVQPHGSYACWLTVGQWRHAMQPSRGAES
jgi:hypothetical protein